jgi:hypothetical protein
MESYVVCGLWKLFGVRKMSSNNQTQAGLYINVLGFDNTSVSGVVDMAYFRVKDTFICSIVIDIPRSHP